MMSLSPLLLRELCAQDVENGGVAEVVTVGSTVERIDESNLKVSAEFIFILTLHHKRIRFYFNNCH